jgi:membrane protein
MGEAAKTFTNLLDGIQGKIESTVVHGIYNLSDPLIDLLMLLAVIGIATTWEMYFSGAFNFGNIIIKCIHIGFIAFLIRNWGQILKIVYESGEQLGLYASGGTKLEATSTYVNTGLGKIFTYLQKVWENNSISTDTVLLYLLCIVCLLVATFAYFKIAYVLFTVSVQFWIVGGLSVCLLPFAMTRWTKSIADKPIGILLTCMVKVMVATFMIGLLNEHINTGFSVTGEAFEVEKALPKIFLDTLSIIFIAFLFGQVVEIAGAMVHGSVMSISNPIDYAGNKAGNFAQQKTVQGARWAYRNTFGRIF